MILYRHIYNIIYIFTHIHICPCEVPLGVMATKELHKFLQGSRTRTSPPDTVSCDIKDAQ